MTFNHSSIDRRVLCLLFIFEAMLFFAVYNREIAWYPPANFDQASYLMSTLPLARGCFLSTVRQVLEGDSECSKCNGRGPPD